MPVVENGLKILDIAYINSGKESPAFAGDVFMIKRIRPSTVGQRHPVLTTKHRRPNISYGKAFVNGGRINALFPSLCPCAPAELAVFVFAHLFLTPFHYATHDLTSF